MTDRNPDVQALIEEARLLLSDSEIGNRASRNRLMGRTADALSALSGEPETEPVYQYGRQSRATGEYLPLRGEPLAEWRNESQEDYLHVRRAVGPWGVVV